MIVIDSVLSPWFVFCQLLPSLHLAVAISLLLSVISSLVTAVSPLGWRGTEARGFVFTWWYGSIGPSLKWWVWVVVANRSIMMVVGRRKLEPDLPHIGCSKAELGPWCLPQLGKILWLPWTHRQRM